MTTLVVNKYARVSYQGKTMYIGRVAGSDEHYGNPFSHRDSSLASQHSTTRFEAVENCEKWLRQLDFLDVEPARRQWILNHLEDLRDRVLICFCKPKACHGDIYVKLLEEASSALES